MGYRNVGLEDDGLTESGNGFVKLPDVLPRKAKGDVGIGKVRLESNGPTTGDDGLSVLPPLAEGKPKIVSFGKPRYAANGLAEGGKSLVKPTFVFGRAKRGPCKKGQES